MLCTFGFTDDVTFAHNGPVAQATQVVVHSGLSDGSMGLIPHSTVKLSMSGCSSRPGSTRSGRSLMSTTALFVYCFTNLSDIS